MMLNFVKPEGQMTTVYVGDKSFAVQKYILNVLYLSIHSTNKLYYL